MNDRPRLLIVDDDPELRQSAVDALSDAGYAEMIASTTLLNRVGAWLAKDTDVHAITDVTGFGLLGHAAKLARASRLTVAIDTARVPYLPGAREAVRDGYVSGGTRSNQASFPVTGGPDL